MPGGVSVGCETYKTKCGVLLKGEGSLFDGSTCYLGIEYSTDNNNVLIPCIYNHHDFIGKTDCEYRAKDFDKIRILNSWCCVSKTNEPYNYENSLEKIRYDNDAENLKNREKLWNEKPLFKGCANTYRYGNEEEISYNLKACLVWEHGCDKPICAVTGKSRNLELVNIYYDTKYSAEIGKLTEHEVILRGIKLTNHPIVKECAERKLKEYQSWTVEDWQRLKRSSVPYRIYLKKGNTKDLMQDLSDAQEGLEITHASDLIKNAVANKRARKIKRKELKIIKLEKKKLKQPKQEPKCEQLSMFD